MDKSVEKLPAMVMGEETVASLYSVIEFLASETSF